MIELMITLSGMSIGCVAGIGIGFVYGWARGQSDGVDLGRQRERRDAEQWQELVSKGGYAKLIPHGGAGHVCSISCYPPNAPELRR